MAESREAVPIAIWRVSGSRAPLPRYMTEGASGCDLAAAIDEEIVLEPLGRALVPTGLAIALPDGFEAQVRPRSGLAVREGITVLNAPGTIDADYRGEVKVALINLGKEDFVVIAGMRIAQMVIAPVAMARVLETESLDEAAEVVVPPITRTGGLPTRGAGGFGSTGL